MLAWLKKVLSSDPLASYARAASGLSILVFLALDVYSSLRARSVAIGLSRDVLIGQAVFISSVYGCGKMGETIQHFADRQDAPGDGGGDGK